MKISKAIFASDDSYFLEFWPIQAKICRELLGIDPVLFYICNEDSDFYSDGHGLVRKIKTVDNVNTGLLACISRMYGTKYFPDDVCITCDLDMLMISKEYFISQVEKYHDDSLVIYSSDAYDLNRPEAIELFANVPFPFTQEMYNYPYNAAKGSTFNKILDTDCSFEEFVRRHASYKEGYQYMWMIDEFYFADCVNHKDHGVEVHKLKRGYTSPWIANNRIERHNFPVSLEIPEESAMQEKFGLYDKELLMKGEYYDANCCRPYSKYKEAIDELVEIVLEQGKLHKKRELIIISSYCDTAKKEAQLRNLVDSLSKKNTLYDVMVVSHTPIPPDIALNCDWAIYDKKNERLERPDCIGPSWATGDGFEINSIYTCPGSVGSHHISIWRMMATGNFLAKMLGYEKVHHIEYDTEISSLKELYENSDLLEDYDVVKYTTGADGTMSGCYMAYRLSSVSDLIKEVREDEWIELTANAFLKNPETLLESIITKNTKVFTKHAEILPEQGIIVNKSMSAKKHLTWCFPYYDPYSKSLGFYVYNDTEEAVKIEIIYNGNLITRYQDPRIWSIFPIDEDYENAKEMTVITNGVIRQIFQFDEIRQHFKNNSYIIRR